MTKMSENERKYTKIEDIKKGPLHSRELGEPTSTMNHTAVRLSRGSTRFLIEEEALSPRRQAKYTGTW